MADQIGKASSNFLISLTITPSQALADQSQAIIATGLTARSKYTIVARMEKKGVIYQSYAYYVANNAGMIDVSSMASRGGSYEGVEPMGLIWYLEPLAPRDLAKSKAALTFHLYFARTWHIDVYLLPGHVTTSAEDGQLPIADSIAHADSERHIDHPKVSRYDIRDGRLKATLFVPEGRGPFLGVLDLYAWVPGVLYERRAALLAARGYVTLALAYAEYEGVLEVNDIQLEYFLEAIDWLYNHPKVAKCGLAIVSHCVSGYVAFHLAAMHPKVKALVTSNCPAYMPMGIVTFQGQTIASWWPGGRKQSPEEVNETLATLSRTSFPIRDALTFPMEQIPDSVEMLLMAGDDDEYVGPDHTLTLVRRLQQAGKTNFKFIINQGQGHACSEPYIPMIRGRFEPNGKVVDFGGKKYDHEKGSERVWTETLDFLEQCKVRLQLNNKLAQL